MAPSPKAWVKKWEDDVANWDPEADLVKRIQGKKDWLKKMEKEGREVEANGRAIPTDLLPGPIASKHSPGYCYAGMIAPLEGLSVKGVIWHQGYNNALGEMNGAEMYRDVFPIMIKAWREAFNDPMMPFGILSLCTQGEPQTLDNYCEAMLNDGIGIREAQYRTFEELYESGDKNIGFVSTYDLRRYWYHPGLKLPAGERIARWAMATQYGFDESFISDEEPGVPGNWSEKSCQWLEQELAKHADKTTIVCSHQLVKDTTTQSERAMRYIHPADRVAGIIARRREHDGKRFLPDFEVKIPLRHALKPNMG